MKYIIGICGASGVIYGLRLISSLLEQPFEVHVIITETGKKVINHETGLNDFSIDKYLNLKGLAFHQNANLIQHDNSNFFSSPASGSFKHDGMVIAPCSMKTLSSITHGLSQNLLTRCADVCLKEKRKLILVPREMPLSPIHLENMLKLSKAGSIIMPPSPAFYFNPKKIDDLVDFVVSRILDHLNIKNNLIQRWGDE